MNYKRTILFFACISLFFSLVALGESKISIETEEVKYNSDYFKAHLRIPVILGLSDEEFEDRINSKFRYSSEKLKNDMESLAKKYYDLSTSENSKMRPYEVSSEFEYTKDDKSLISIIISFYEYTGGAHGNNYNTAFTIDTLHNKELKLSDLFKEGYDYQSKIIKTVHDNIDLDPSVYFKNAKKSITHIDDTTRFYIDKNYLVVYYDLYEISPYSTGIPMFKIPLKEFGSAYLYK